MSYTYMLNVVRHEPISAEQRERWERGYIRENLPERAATTSLSVELTEEQWLAVQKAVLETFK